MEYIRPAVFIGCIFAKNSSHEFEGWFRKTTVTTNLVSALSCTGLRPALIDLDPQGSSTRWLANRPASLASIIELKGFKTFQVTKTWHLRTPENSDLAVIDTPAGLTRQELISATRGADAILIPVMPSDIDIHAVMKCIDLLLVAKIPRPDMKIGIIANRVSEYTSVRSAEKFYQAWTYP